MPTLVDFDQLVGATEIAHRIGFTRPQLVHTWRGRHPDFPAPLGTISRVQIWLWPDVQEWARRHGRLRPGDPWFL